MRLFFEICAVVWIMWPGAAVQAQRFLKHSTAVNVPIISFVDVTDGFTPETGLVPATMDEVTLYKHGTDVGSDVKGTSALTHRSGGTYTLTLTTGNTDTLGPLSVHFRDDSVCLPVWSHFNVLTASAYESMFGTGVGLGGQLLNTTVSGAPTSQTVFVLTAGPNVDDWPNGQAVILTDVSNGDSPSVRNEVEDYVGATKTLTLARPPNFTIIAGDGVQIVLDTGTEPDTRDLQAVQFVWKLPTRAGGSTTSENKLNVTAGESIRAGFDCSPVRGLQLNAGTVLASMTTPALVTPSSDVTLTELGIDARFAKVLVTVDASATPGEHWVKTTVATSAGGAVTLFGRVVVVAGP